LQFQAVFGVCFLAAAIASVPSSSYGALDPSTVMTDDINGAKYAYISVSTSDLASVTDEQYELFAKDVLAQQGDIEWFSIILDDNRTIEFPQASSEKIRYGIFSAQNYGAIDEFYQTIIPDSNFSFQKFVTNLPTYDTKIQTAKTEKVTADAQAAADLQAAQEKAAADAQAAQEKAAAEAAASESHSTSSSVTPSTQHETTTSQSGDSKIIVYVTNTGEKYHVDGCRYLSRSQNAITLQEAKNEGYTPCSVCHPPQ
jgi:hypothetical protein